MTDEPTKLQDHDDPVIYTDKAQCRDCYRCVRACPVKAIRMEDGQASVVSDLCIGCGTCIRECPQHAKAFRNDLTRARNLLIRCRTTALSIAPSFAALFSDWQRRRLPSALRQLGFSHVSETSIGAYFVAHETVRLMRENPDKPQISSACPAAVKLIEKYYPECVEFLSPVVSPMIAHARLLRKKLGEDCGVVFIGPCVAKKQEAQRPGLAGDVDVVLTFAELQEWLESEGVDLAACEESAFDDEPLGDARYFPLAGGSFLAAEITPDMLACDVLSVSGHDEIADALAALEPESKGLLIEPLFCPQGCINGPVFCGENKNLFHRRRDILTYSALPKKQAPAGLYATVELAASFQADDSAIVPEFTEQQIQEVFDRTGKSLPEEQLNCGACGYPSCREKAIAVLRGLAEAEMCIPFMRRLAERRTDLIIETSPNGIVILDEHLQIISMNKAFQKMFSCAEAVLGRPISYLMDPDMFEKAELHDGFQETIVRHDSYGVICHQVVYRLPDAKQYVGIFVNITNVRDNQKKLDDLREQTVIKAQEILDQQISMAQQIAEYLGTSTAKSEELLENLLKMTQDPGTQPGKDKSTTPFGRGSKWNPHTYMSR